MLECRHCREMVRGDMDAIGSRCPRCRMPLYERVQLPRRLSAGDGGVACACHPEVQGVGNCQRCGASMCFGCRTRWHEQTVCAACVERALSGNETPPAIVAAHRRQALLGLVLSLAGWLLFLLGTWPLITVQTSHTSTTVVYLASLLILSSFIPALFAIGLAATAIRARGQRMKIATYGLVSAGTHVGLMIGFLLLNIWHN